MVKTYVSVSIEEKLLKKLNDYILSKDDKPSRSSIICSGLEKELNTLMMEKRMREGRDISITR